MNERIRLWTIVDPRGLSITLVADVWQDILRKHPELSPFLEQVRRTTEQPDEIFFDPETTAKRATGAQIHLYYRRRLAAAHEAQPWVIVVVKVVREEGDQQGYVETAHLTNRKKRRAVLTWNR